MATSDLVLIDTCIWVQFFNRPHSADKRAVDLLLDDDRAALIGPILTEVLIGFRRNEHAEWVASVLRGLHFLEPAWDEWRLAAQLGRQFMAKATRFRRVISSLPPLLAIGIVQSTRPIRTSLWFWT